MIESALTANIRSKMALDDYVKAHDQRRHVRSVVTLTGVVASANEHERAVRLARETDGVTQAVDRLQIKMP